MFVHSHKGTKIPPIKTILPCTFSYFHLDFPQYTILSRHVLFGHNRNACISLTYNSATTPHEKKNSFTKKSKYHTFDTAASAYICTYFYVCHLLWLT